MNSVRLSVRQVPLPLDPSLGTGSTGERHRMCSFRWSQIYEPKLRAVAAGSRGKEDATASCGSRVKWI